MASNNVQRYWNNSRVRGRGKSMKYNAETEPNQTSFHSQGDRYRIVYPDPPEAPQEPNGTLRKPAASPSGEIMAKKHRQNVDVFPVGPQSLMGDKKVAELMAISGDSLKTPASSLIPDPGRQKQSLFLDPSGGWDVMNSSISEPFSDSLSISESLAAPPGENIPGVSVDQPDVDGYQFKQSVCRKSPKNSIPFSTPKRNPSPVSIETENLPNKTRKELERADYKETQESEDVEDEKGQKGLTFQTPSDHSKLEFAEKTILAANKTIGVLEDNLKSLKKDFIDLKYRCDVLRTGRDNAINSLNILKEEYSCRSKLKEKEVESMLKTISEAHQKELKDLQVKYKQDLKKANDEVDNMLEFCQFEFRKSVELLQSGDLESLLSQLRVHANQSLPEISPKFFWLPRASSDPLAETEERDACSLHASKNVSSEGLESLPSPIDLELTLTVLACCFFQIYKPSPLSLTHLRANLGKFDAMSIQTFLKYFGGTFSALSSKAFDVPNLD